MKMITRLVPYDSEAWLWNEFIIPLTYAELPRTRTLIGPISAKMYKGLHKQIRYFYYNFNIQFAFRYY